MRPLTAWFKALTASPGVVEALQDRRTNFYIPLGGTNEQQINAAFQRGIAATYGWFYGQQPAVRSVIDYIALNAAQLPFKLYERVSDTARERREDHPAAISLANPDDRTPGEVFIRRLITDYLVYDNAYVLKTRANPGAKLVLSRIPPATVTVSGGRFKPDFYNVWRVDGTAIRVLPDNILHWQGYNPEDPLLGLSKLETLRQQLISDSVLQTALTELAKKGLRRGHIERPLDAPQWAETGRMRFQESWRNLSADETAVLEEGMKFVRDAMSPEDAQLLDSRRFTREEAANQYGMDHCPPQDDEERKQFYADVIAPLVKSLACYLDFGLLRAEFSETTYYFEADLNEKLRGDLEGRFQAITAAVGGPWMTRAEARARENLPDLGEVTNELILPRNVIEEDPNSPRLPAPNVMPPQDPNKPPQDGSYRQQSLSGSEQLRQVLDANRALLESYSNGHGKALEVTTAPRKHADMARQKRSIDKFRAGLERHYTRQSQSMKSKSSKVANTERWNSELAAALEPLLKSVVELEGGIHVSRFGGNDFDMREVEHFLKAMAEGTAQGINDATQRDIEEAGIVLALERAKSQRAQVAANNIGARVTLFARQEAAKQSPFAELRTQTWVKDTERHKALDGKSVPLGSDWGGISPGSEPNCACTAVIS